MTMPSCSSERTADDTPLVLGDPDELKAAVSNLIDNAVKYLGRHRPRACRARGA